MTSVEQVAELRQRLANTNAFFRRKADDKVLNDEAALRLLADFYDDVVVELANFDQGQNGISLAKLTAAHFVKLRRTRFTLQKLVNGS